MIETGRHPAYGRVAFVTLGRCQDMRGIFALRRTAVVATGAGSRAYIDMIEHRGCPGVRRVAIVAGIATGDVVRCLALCRRPVMTACAGAEHVGMVHAYHRDPAAVPVAVLAQVRGLDVRCIFSFCCRAVVATGTVTANTGVIEVGRGPGIRRVAVITGSATGDVGWCLALCRRPVMTACTGAEHVGVVHAYHRDPAAV